PARRAARGTTAPARATTRGGVPETVPRNVRMTPLIRERRRLLSPERPHAFFIENERSQTGAVVSIATVILTNRECPWRCIYCDLWKNTITETVPPGAIPAQIDFALDQFWRCRLSW